MPSDKEIPWFTHSFVSPPTDPLTVQLVVLVEDLDPLEGPQTVGRENYSRISQAFVERGWAGFEEEFERAVPRNHPDYATTKRDLLCAPLFRLTIHRRMARLVGGEVSVEDVLKEADNPTPRKPN